MRLLLIEDDASLASLLRRGLELEGHTVEVAVDGTTGHRLARFGDPDVIICDLMLPGLNGFEVVRRLRAERVWTPILVLTAKDGEYDQADALDLGADDYLTKPVSLVVLAARVRALLRRPPLERPATLELGGLTLDPARHLAAAGGVELPLTSREFTLLEYLARNADRVLTKGQILDHVWDPDFDGDDNVVEVYVSRLRRKLAASPAGVAIRTVHGVGYRLSGPS